MDEIEKEEYLSKGQWLSYSAMKRLVRAHFPAAFPRGEKKAPLKVGVHVDLVTSLPGIRETNVRKFLGYYTGKPRYLRSLVAGAARVDLGGVACGVVTSRQEVQAKIRLAKIELTKVEEALS